MENPGKRPSSALVISLLALFVALGGTGYAALKINGKDIRKGSIAGSKLKKNTLTGKQIREAGLGQVPTAARAAEAASAANAALLDGRPAGDFAKSSQFLNTYTQADRGAETTIFERGPFRLTLVCVSSSSGGNPVARGLIRIDVAADSMNSMSSPGQDTLLPAGSSVQSGPTGFVSPAQRSTKLVGGYFDTANGRTLDFSSRIRMNSLGNSWCDSVTQASFGGV